MYKSKLYELCQKRAWARPDYNVIHYGPGHNSRYRASVLVNGNQFNVDDLSRSSKEAQNKVSQVALEHFASARQESSPPSIGAARGNIRFKRQLHQYALKNHYDLPIYAYVCEGPGNALRYKAEVTVGKRTVQGTMFYTSMKEAECDAAKTALMLLTADENNSAKDDLVSYTTLLNDFAQKANISMPSYKTKSNGVDGFSSIVDVGNSSFSGDVGKSERQAENNAAKFAWLKLNEGHGADSGKDIHLPSSSKHVPLIFRPAVSQDLEESPNTENGSEACLDDDGKNDSVKDFLTKEHDLKMKKVASQVRPLDVKSNPRKSKCPMVEEEVWKLNVFDPSKKLKFGEEAEALEEKLKKQKILVMELKIERINLERDTMELILKGNNKSDA